MLNVVRQDFEVVKEGRIFYNPKDFTRLNLVASGTFSGDGQVDRLKEDDILPETLKHLFARVILQRFV